MGADDPEVSKVWEQVPYNGNRFNSDTMQESPLHGPKKYLYLTQFIEFVKKVFGCTLVVSLSAWPKKATTITMLYL